MKYQLTKAGQEAVGSDRVEDELGMLGGVPDEWLASLVAFALAERPMSISELHEETAESVGKIDNAVSAHDLRVSIAQLKAAGLVTEVVSRKELGC